MTASVEYLSLWRGVIRCEPLRLTMREVAEHIWLRYKITRAELVGPSRCRSVAWPRQEFMAMCYEQGHLSLPQIGRFLNRDHTTVLHGIRAYRKRCQAEGLG